MRRGEAREKGREEIGEEKILVRYRCGRRKVCTDKSGTRFSEQHIGQNGEEKIWFAQTVGENTFELQAYGNKRC